MCRVRRRWVRSMCRILREIFYILTQRNKPSTPPIIACAVPRLSKGYTYRCTEQCPVANPSGASGTKDTFCPLRILTVQAKRVWNPQVLGNHERNDAVQIGTDFSSYQEDEPEA